MPNECFQEIGLRCDVEGCDSRIVGLEDGWEFTRGLVCADCIEHLREHNHWPDMPETECPYNAAEVL